MTGLRAEGQGGRSDVIPLLTQVGVEVLDLLLAAAAFGRLLEASLGAGVLDDALAVDLLLEAAESLVDGLAFANLDSGRFVNPES